VPLIKIINQEKDDIFKSQLLLAGRCIAECDDVSNPRITQVLKKIYYFWFQYKYLTFINSVILILPPASSEEIQPIIKCLKHDDYWERRDAIFMLGRIASEAVKALKTLLGNASSQVRYTAAKALMQIRLNPTIKPEEKSLRQKIAEGFPQVASEPTVEVLIATLGHPKYDVRQAATIALNPIDVKPSIEALILALGHQNKRVRQGAITALSRINSDYADEALITALWHENRDVRKSVARILGYMNSEEIVDILLNTLEEEEDEFVIAEAAASLGWIGSEKAIQPLIKLFGDDNYYGCDIEEALDQIGTAEVLKQFTQNPGIDIYNSSIFYIARQIATRLHQENLPFIPVYPELIKSSVQKTIERYLMTPSLIWKKVEYVLVLYFWIPFKIIFINKIFLLLEAALDALPFMRDDSPE
jgi:HEAT repeat protein